MQRLPQLLKVVVDSWDDNGDIVTSIGRLRWNWDRLIYPVAYEVDDCSQVSIEPETPISLELDSMKPRAKVPKFKSTNSRSVGNICPIKGDLP